MAVLQIVSNKSSQLIITGLFNKIIYVLCFECDSPSYSRTFFLLLKTSSTVLIFPYPPPHHLLVIASYSTARGWGMGVTKTHFTFVSASHLVWLRVIPASYTPIISSPHRPHYPSSCLRPNSHLIFGRFFAANHKSSLSNVTEFWFPHSHCITH